MRAVSSSCRDGIGSGIRLAGIVRVPAQARSLTPDQSGPYTAPDASRKGSSRRASGRSDRRLQGVKGGADMRLGGVQPVDEDQMRDAAVIRNFSTADTRDGAVGKRIGHHDGQIGHHQAPARVSPSSSTEPGQSISAQSSSMNRQEATDISVEMPRARASGAASPTVLRSFAVPRRSVAPAAMQQRFEQRGLARAMRPDDGGASGKAGCLAHLFPPLGCGRPRGRARRPATAGGPHLPGRR